jgi:hypothetical protein
MCAQLRLTVVKQENEMSKVIVLSDTQVNVLKAILMVASPYDVMEELRDEKIDISAQQADKAKIDIQNLLETKENAIVLIHLEDKPNRDSVHYVFNNKNELSEYFMKEFVKNEVDPEEAKDWVEKVFEGKNLDFRVEYIK